MRSNILDGFYRMTYIKINISIMTGSFNTIVLFVMPLGSIIEHRIMRIILFLETTKLLELKLHTTKERNSILTILCFSKNRQYIRHGNPPRLDIA